MLITRTFDDFDRTAAADNLGGVWTDQRGAGLGVNGNQAYSAAGVRSSLYTAGSLSPDQWSEVVIGATGTTGGARGVGLVVRGSGNSGNGTESGYYFEVLTDGSNSYRIYKLVNNTETTIVGPTVLPETASAGDVMRFEVQGTTLQAYLNDTVLTTQVDTSIATGRAGLLVRGTAPRANDFASGEFLELPEYTRVPVDSDSFNRANGGLGGEWLNAGQGLAGFQIIGNQLGGSVNTAAMLSQYTGDIPSPNQYASITITALGTGSAAQLNPWVRLNGTGDTRTGYGPNWRHDTGDLFIARRNSDGSETVLAEFSQRMPAVGDVLTTEVVSVAGGNLIRIYINDELIGSALDNTPGYEDGTTGIAGYRNTTRADNFNTGVLQTTGANEDPVADNDAVAVLEGETTGNLVPTLLAGDTDPDAGDVLRIVAVTQGASGTVTFDPGTAAPGDETVTYTANAVLDAGQSIIHTFTYTVSDGNGGSDTANVTVTVTGVNEAPSEGELTLITRAYDDFDRAAAADNLGGVWTDQRGAGLGVNGNQAYSAAGVRSSLYTAGSLSPDQWAEVVIGATGTTGGARGVGLVVRGSGNSGNGTESGYYFEVLTDGSNSYRIYKLVNNTETTIVGPTVLPETASAGDVMRFEMYGTTQRAYLNDTLLATQTDTSIAAGRAGLLVRGTTPRANDFASGEFLELPEYTRVAVDADNFNRANGGLGAEWLNAGQGLAGFQIIGNQLGGSVNTAAMLSQYTGEIASPNQFASITITALGSGSAAQLNPWVRLNGSGDTRTGYGPNWRHDTGDLFIARRNSDGSETVLAEFSRRMPTVGDVLTTEVVSVAGGNLIRIYINDELIGSALDNTPGYEDGTTGIAGYRNTTRADNFVTGVLQTTAANEAPVADNDAVAVLEDATTGNLATTLLTGDTDPNAGDVLRITAVTQGTKGSVTFNPGTAAPGDETVVYQADGSELDALAAGETTTDTFAYTVSDGNGGTDTANVTVTITGVNDAPVAEGDDVGMPEDASPPGNLVPWLLNNDTDPEVGDVLRVTAVTQGTKGTVTFDPGTAAPGDETVTYAADGAVLDALAVNELTTDTFTYTVSDGNGGTDTATVTIHILGVNDAPAADDDAAAVLGDATTGNLVPTLLAGDTDPDAGDVLRVTAVTQGTKGTVVFNPGTAAPGDETVTYTADSAVVDALAPGETTTDTFTYTVADGNGGSDTASVTVTISGEPPSGGALISRSYDDFDRTAVADNLGGVWTDQRGAGLGVNGNQAYSAAGVRSSLYTDGSLSPDQWAEVVIGATGTTGGARGIGLVVRGSGTSGNGTESGYYFEVLTDGSNSYRIYRLVNNTETTILGPTALPETATAGDVMRFEVQGTTLRAYLNDTLLTTQADTSIAAGRAGLLVRGTAPRANDFASGDFIQLPEYTRVAVDADNFNRANGGLGAEWLNSGQGLAGFQIIGNQVGGAVSDVSLMSQYTGEIASPNQFASITITEIGASGSGRQVNPWVRIDGIDEARIGYGPSWRLDNGHLVIYRRNDGTSETVIAEFSPRMPAVGDVLTTEVLSVAGGNVIRVYINDELIGSALDNAPGYEDGTTGLIGYRNTARGDNFVTGVLQITPTEPLPTPAGDANALVEDGASLVATGNVLANDTPASGLSVSAVQFGATPGTVGSVLAGAYGTLVLNADGSYTYTLANALPAVQSLGFGDTVQDIFTYTASNGAGAVDATLTLTITGANDDPEADDDVTSVQEDATTGNLAATLLTGDSDPEAGDVLRIIAVTQGDKGTVTFNAGTAAPGDETVTYAANGAVLDALAAGETTTDTFIYTVGDGNGGADSASLTVTITGVNDAPVVGGTVAGSVQEDGTLTASGTLTISDADSGQSGFQAQTDIAGTYGTFSLLAGGGWTYALDNAAANVQALASGQTVTDVFQAVSQDGSVSQPVTITIAGAAEGPGAGDDSAQATEAGGLNNGTAGVNPGGNVLTNDTFDTGSVPAVSAVNGVAGNVGTAVAGDYGTLTLGADGAYEYVVNNNLVAVQALAGSADMLTDSFTYTASNGLGGTDDATLIITIVGANDVPVISGSVTGGVQEDGTTAAGSTLTINDPDSAQSSFQAQVSTAGVYGTFALTAAGAWTYALANTAAGVQALGSGESVTDVFQAVSLDGTATQQITITVTGANDAPVAGNDSVTTDEDTPLVGTLPTATDVDGDAVTYALVTDGANGAAVVDADGAFSYTPNGNFNGSDSFTYSVSDGNGGSNTYTVSVTVDDGSDAPVADDDTAAVAEDATTGNLVGTLLTGDTDPDAGDVLRVSAVTQGTKGTVTFDAGTAEPGDETVTYTADGAVLDALAAGETTTDTFTYTVSDGNGGSDTASVTVTINGVNDVPVVGGTSAGSVQEDGTATASGTLTISDPDSGQSSFQAQTDTDGTYGTFSLLAGGGWTYALDNDAANVQALASGESVTDVFQAVSLDGTATQQITITVTGTNDAPTAGNDSVTTDEDAPWSGSLPAATDIDADAVTYALVTDGTNGTAVVDPDGAFSYTPNENFHGSDSFTYSVSDGNGGSNTYIVDVTIEAMNDAPVADDDEAAVLEDATTGNLVGTLLAGDTDVDAGDVLRVTAVTQGAKGSVTFNAGTAAPGDETVTYAANGAVLDALAVGQTTTDTFTYTVSDGNGGSDTASVTVTINGVNDVPVVGGTFGRNVQEDAILTASGALTISDADSGQSAFQTHTNTAGTYGTFSLLAGGGWTYALNNAAANVQALAGGQMVTDVFQAVSLDGTVSQPVTIMVFGTNDAPTDIGLSANDVVENVPGATVGVLSVVDPDAGATATYSIRPGLDGSLFTISGNELRVGSTALDYETAATRAVTVRATDTFGAFVDRTFTIDVLNVTEVALTAGADTLAPSADNTQVIGNATTLNATDNLDGGDGTDSLVLFGAVNFNLNSLAGYSGFEEQRLVNLTSSTATLTLRNDTTSSVVTSGTGSSQIVVSGTAIASSIQGGDASDSVNLQATGTLGSFSGGANNDNLLVQSTTAWNPALTFDGGSGTDTLQFSGGSFDLRSATLSSVETLSLSGSLTSVLIGADTLTGVTSISGSTGSRLIATDVTLNLAGKSLSGVTVESSNATGTVFTVGSANHAFQIFGGMGADSLVASGFAFSVDQRDAIFNTASIETITDITGTYTAPPLAPGVVKLTGGADTVTGTGGDDTINGTSVTLNSTDNLVGGAGTDVLALYGGGTFNLNLLAGYSGFEEQRLVNYSNTTASLFLRNGTTTSVVTSGTGPSQIFFGSSASVSTIEGGDGSDSVTLQGTGTLGSFSGGGGSDILQVTSALAWNPVMTFDGGSGSDSLRITGVGVFDLRSATLSSVESLSQLGSQTTALIDTNTLTGVTSISGSSGSRLITADAALNLSGKSLSGVTVESSNAAGTTFTVNSTNTAFFIFGGTGADSIVASGFAFSAAQRDAIFAASLVETITDTSGTYAAPPLAPGVVKLTGGADTVTGTGGDDTINGTSVTLNSTDNLDGGAGTDVLALYGGGTFNLDSLAGYSGFEEQRLVNFTNSSASLTLRNGTTTSVVTGGTGLIQINVNSGTTASSIQGGDGTVFVVLQGSGTLGSFSGGSGADSVLVQEASAWNPALTFDGGSSNDTLQLSGGGSFDLRLATLSSVESLSLSGSLTTALIDADTLTDFTSISGTTGSRLITADATLNLSGKSLSGVTVESTNATGTVFTVNSTSTAFQIIGGVGSDSIVASFTFSAAQRDAIFSASSIELIRDSSGFYGDDTANVITGTAAGEFIQGGAGNDILTGLGGSDTITGGGDNDTFVFANGSGADTITDFVADGSIDSLDISDFGFADFDAVLAAATQVGNDVRIQLDGDDMITLIGVQKTALTTGDFILS